MIKKNTDSCATCACMKSLSRRPELRLVGICPLGFRIEENRDDLLKSLRQRNPDFKDYIAIPLEHCPHPKSNIAFQKILISLDDKDPDDPIKKRQDLKSEIQKIHKRVINMIAQDNQVITSKSRMMKSYKYFLIDRSGRILKANTYKTIARKIYSRLLESEKNLISQVMGKMTHLNYVQSIIHIGRYIQVSKTSSGININPEKIAINQKQENAINELLKMIESD